MEIEKGLLNDTYFKVCGVSDVNVPYSENQLVSTVPSLTIKWTHNCPNSIPNLSVRS